MASQFLKNQTTYACLGTKMFNKLIKIRIKMKGISFGVTFFKLQ